MVFIKRKVLSVSPVLFPECSGNRGGRHLSWGLEYKTSWALEIVL